MNYSVNTKYIPNGTQVPMNESNPALLTPFGLEPKKYFMLCSRLVKHKGVHVFIDAWKKVKALRPDLAKNMKIAIVGGSAFTDAYVKSLHERAADEPSIVLTGTQIGESLHSLFANSYAIVHPSESEGLPIAVLEAMSYGKCVLSSDIPENMELTKDHGMTFHVGDVNDLAQKMIMLLEAPELVAAVGSEARTHVAKHYDWKDIAETTEYLYELVCLDPALEEAKV